MFASRHTAEHTLRALARAPGTPGLLARIRLALMLARQRRALLHLDDTMLRDIGLSRDAAEAEARRPIWDVPQSWLR